MKEFKVRITFTDPILGSKPADPELHSRFVASKAPDHKTMREEIESIGVDAVEERGMTVFSRMEDGNPCLWDYQVRGFFKEACGALRNVPTTKSGAKAPRTGYYKFAKYKSKIDDLIFVEPRQIPLWIPIELDLSDTDCQRPLRASTPQGERVALAHSEEAPERTYIEITVICLVDEHVELVKEWLDYGKWKGMGQWRNSGKGRFTWEEI